MTKLQQLQEQYPLIYDKCFDFSVEKGWYNLIDALSAIVDSEIESTMTSIKIVQVKEKFGGLRFYTSGITPKLDGAIMLAETLSTMICEKCGKPGKLEVNWLKILCEECNAT